MNVFKHFSIFVLLMGMLTYLLFMNAFSNLQANSTLNISVEENTATKSSNTYIFQPTETPHVLYKTEPMPDNYMGVSVEIKVKSTQNTNDKTEYVFRTQIFQQDAKSGKAINKLKANPIRTFSESKANQTRTIELESCYQAKKGLPIYVKIERINSDVSSTDKSPLELEGTIIALVKKLPDPIVVENKKGYNSWPMIQAWKGKLYYLYTRGAKHTISEGARDTFLKISSDNGKTWSDEIPFATDQSCGEVPIGKGLDENGNILFWVRSMSRTKPSSHKLYMSSDGVNFKVISTPKLSPFPMQIMDVFKVPNVGLMALWFATDYKTDKNSWGTLVSKDNGKTWKQTIIESNLNKKNHHTEPSAVYLGNGKILAISRVQNNLDSTEKAQFQLESRDYGKTWTRSITNISDVLISTPSLIYDEKTGLISNYYYQRDRGMLKRRVAKADEIFGNPLAWDKPEIIAFASAIGYDAGNVNATKIGDTHYMAYYSGNSKQAEVVISSAPAPKEKDSIHQR